MENRPGAKKTTKDDGREELEEDKGSYCVFAQTYNSDSDDSSDSDVEMEVVLGAIHEVNDPLAGNLAIGAPPPPTPTPRQSWALMMAREYTIEEMENQPCRLHITEKNPTRHLLKDCHM